MNKEKGLVMIVKEGLLPWPGKAEVKRCRLPSRGNVPRDSIDKDTHHESTGHRKAMKYLRESCYHRIEYSVTNSLAALMRK